jgi:hypothetical protein
MKQNGTLGNQGRPDRRAMLALPQFWCRSRIVIMRRRGVTACAYGRHVVSSASRLARCGLSMMTTLTPSRPFVRMALDTASALGIPLIDQSARYA